MNSRPSTRRVRVARGCWISPHDSTDLAALCAAAVETSAQYTVIASITAARLLGLWLPPASDRIHLATAEPGRPGRGMTRTRRPEFTAHRFQLRPEDIVTINGLQVTSAARTWRDLARILPLADLVAAGDSVLRSGTTIGAIEHVLDRHPNGSYLAVAREALALLDARSRSRPESHLRVAISAPDLPRFAINQPIFRNEGGWLAEPDLSLAAAKIALEYQGEQHAELERMRRDLTRFKDLRSENWLPLAYGPAEVFGRPWEVRAEVRQVIRERAPNLIRCTRYVRSTSARATVGR